MLLLMLLLMLCSRFGQLFGRGVVCGQVFAVLSAVAPASMLKLDVENEREVRSHWTFRSFESEL